MRNPLYDEKKSVCSCILMLAVAAAMTACANGMGKAGEAVDPGRPGSVSLEQPAERQQPEAAAKEKPETAAKEGTASPLAPPADRPASPPLPSAGPAPGSSPEAASQEQASAEEAPVPIAQVVLQALKEQDMERLAALSHPDKGVRFSPYAYVEAERDLVFTPEQLTELLQDGTVYEWGAYDGSGEPIRSAFAEYYKRFVFDADFTAVREPAVNERIGQSNTLSNLEEVYPLDKHAYVEFYLPGSDPKAEGMDWKSLRLVFERAADRLLLVGIVHDQWTI